MYVHRNNGAPSYNHCRTGKAINSEYSECVFIALRIHHATRMRHNVACGLSGCTTFFHTSHKGRDFQEIK